MAKVHVVREAFSLDGKDYVRGDEIADDAVLAKIKETHGHHLNAQASDIPQPTAATVEASPRNPVKPRPE